ncbi:hypothetical protein A8F94_12735 [Bacillus sp. FJAT-27225]|uniref:hypothetical protein n=1 Tax=Bacillus sp. FJAT-27225 TaxID=1743144 RepID=UPI00080C28A3|nr:hypothetical protein [Bacillus sp. FJAT-27225]OCA85734.1 hypothetical protein A8F94_12735 [Bacillus sp. FJAT-27225]
MSLTKINLSEAIKKQFFHKLKANIDAFSAMVGIQILGLLFSIGGVGSSGMSGDGLSVTVKYYSADVVIGFTLMWAFVTAITVNTRANREQDFTFITNRLSSSISNILFLAVAGLLASITANLTSNLLNVLVYLFFEKEVYTAANGAEGLITSIGGTFLYLILISSVGYFISSLGQISKLFLFLIPFIVIGFTYLNTLINFTGTIELVQFYVQEKSLSLFTLKALITAGLFYSAGVVLFNRMEVRK